MLNIGVICFKNDAILLMLSKDLEWMGFSSVIIITNKSHPIINLKIKEYVHYKIYRVMLRASLQSQEPRGINYMI